MPPLPSIQPPGVAPQTGPGGLPALVQGLVAQGLNVAGLAAVGVLSIRQKLVGNVAFEGYMTVRDGNGVVRLELGNIPVNGVSPAQIGFRVNDASGNPIVDGLGVIGPMTSLAQQSSGVLNQQIAGPVTASAINSSSVTFSLPRALRVLTMYSAIFSMVTGGTGFVYVNARMDSSDSGANNHHFMLAGGGSASSVMGFNVRVDSLSAGAHTADITCDVDASTTIQVYKTGLYVFQLGS